MTALGEKDRLARQDSLEAVPQYSPRDDVSEALVTDGFQLPSIDTETEQPPPYGENPDQVQFSQPGFETTAAVTGMATLSTR